MRRTCLAKLALLAAVAGSAPACVAAAAAGAGAIYVNTRGAESTIDGQPADIAPRVASAFSSMNIQQTGHSTEKEGDQLGFKGTTADLDINVTVERKSPTTSKVEVTARKNLAEWDKDYAKAVLSRIVSGS